jgi:hypothetical protein
VDVGLDAQDLGRRLLTVDAFLLPLCCFIGAFAGAWTRIRIDSRRLVTRSEFSHHLTHHHQLPALPAEDVV